MHRHTIPGAAIALLLAGAAMAQPSLLIEPSQAPITLKGGWENKQGVAGHSGNRGDIAVRISKINPDGTFEGKLDFYSPGRWCRAVDEPIKEGRITAKGLTVVGLPALGVSGAALAALISRGLVCGAMLVTVYRRRPQVAARPGDFQPPPGIPEVEAAEEEHCISPREAEEASGLAVRLPRYLPAGFAQTCIQVRRHHDYGEVQVVFSDGLSLLSLIESLPTSASPAAGQASRRPPSAWGSCRGAGTTSAWSPPSPGGARGPTSPCSASSPARSSAD